MDEGFDIGASAWGAPKHQPELATENVEDVLAKEKLVKEIVAMQDGLRGLLERADDVGAECNKKKAENEMLQTYINNLTRQNMMFASAK